MPQPQFYWLGISALIFAFRQVSMMTLSKHRRLGSASNYISTLLMMITVDLALLVINHFVAYMGMVFTILYVAFVLWAYLPSRKTKRTAGSVAKIDRWLNRVGLVVAFVSLTLFANGLYLDGYQWGYYDALLWTNTKIPDLIGNLHEPTVRYWSLSVPLRTATLLDCVGIILVMLFMVAVAFDKLI